MLEHLGLDDKTLAVYEHLLAGGQACDLPESRVGALAELGLVRPPDRPSEPPALVDPRVALTNLLAGDRAAVSSLHARLARDETEVERWLGEHAAEVSRLRLPAEQLIGVSEVRDKLAELQAGCRSTVWSLNPGGAQSPDNLARSLPLCEASLGRGVEMRAIFLDSIRNDEATIGHTRTLVDLGAEVRTLPVLPLRLVMVDGESAVLPADAADSSMGALLVRTPGILTSLEALFRELWRQARPVGASRPQAAGAPKAQELVALDLWRRGGTDALVATRLGISERTVRRMSDHLCDRLGARSRFDLGVRALLAGWIDADDLC